jgi:uncharacterized pyridoxamine 5'-phosphate oxidase family protein
MKKLICLLSVLLLAAGLNRAWASDRSDILRTETQEQQQALTEVYDFLKKCGHYFIATVDGDQPRVRPFGTAIIFEGKLYIQTGKKKNVSRQMRTNPKIEICALDLPAGQWLRIAATVVTDDRREAKQYILDQQPELKSMYSADDDNTHLLYLKDVTATFSSFAGEPREVTF